ncbi:NPCBM/NEW2 domain-containing protein [Deinococcus marmoris]|uniref:Alpha-galactosidase n=1 Tax=Deinococcus marmoris TaxID=249408 RepID=A0A1U7NRQ9_9DEIO|nr:NPCBM/NEW2 domain-containing protein [Deinococcus marmoris]OLV15597.1 alpha-galactosidase [Deinococcus marmoris]
MSHSPRSALSLTALALTLTLAACSQQTAAPQSQADKQDGSQFVYDGTDRSWVSPDNGLVGMEAEVARMKALTINTGNNMLSGEAWTAATSGYGPIERNMSNGESGARDGRMMAVNGKKYDSGFGVHANSSITFNLGGKCKRFISDVGIDDEVGNQGSVVFQVFADGVKVFDSGRMTGADAAKTVNVDVSGRSELKLVVGDAGDNNYYDHADWGGAVLVDCNSSGTPTSPAPAPAPATWTRIAGEGESFSVSGTQSVRYGAGTAWIVKDVTSNGQCTNGFFGNDPAYGTTKSCEINAPAPTPAPVPAPTPPAPTPPSGNVNYSGPFVITKGGTYRGNWESMNPNVPAVLIQTSEPVVIEGSNLRGRGELIRGWKVNLTVRNSNGYGMNPNVYGGHAGRFIAAEEVYNLRVENNYMEGTSGIYVNLFYGKGDGQTIKILRNKAKNIDGRLSDGNGGYNGGRYYVQFAQIAKVQNVPGMEIAWNQVINEPGLSSLEENINLYSTSGTAGSRMQIHDNYIQGAFAIKAATDGAYSGGGIMLGDGPVGNLGEAGGYVDVYNNQIVSTSNQGIGIAGGHDHNVFNNRILSSGRLPTGEINKAQNVGIYVWDVMNGKGSNTWFNNTVHDNVIGWTRVNANNSTWLNNTWFADCSNTCYNNASWSGAVTMDTEKQEFQMWQNKFRAAGMSMGPN